MPFYIIDYDENEEGERHVHVDSEECYRIPLLKNRIALGFHENCHAAMDAAAKLYDNANGCYNCCQDCYISKETENLN